jgi:hypothetical protein
MDLRRPANFGDLSEPLDRPQPEPLRVEQVTVLSEILDAPGTCPGCGWRLSPGNCEVIGIRRVKDPRLPRLNFVVGVRCAAADLVCNTQEPA